MEQLGLLSANDGSLAAALVVKGRMGLGLEVLDSIQGMGRGEYKPLMNPDMDEIVCLSSFHGNAWAHLRKNRDAWLVHFEEEAKTWKTSVTVKPNAPFDAMRAFLDAGLNEELVRQSISEDGYWIRIYCANNE